MNKLNLVIAFLILAVGIALGYWLFGGVNPSASPAQLLVEENKQPLFYRSPMDPNITSPVPAKGPMGMDYIPVFADEEVKDVSGTVKIDPVVEQNMGVRTARAEYRTMARAVRALGRVDFDEESLVQLHPKVSGWIDEIHVDKTGQVIVVGEKLLSIYSPQLVSAQQEYLLALNNLSALESSPFAEIKQGAESLVASSRERLQLLDVPEDQIRALEKSRTIKKSLPIRSPVSGTAIHLGARRGQHVTPAVELYRVTDLRRVWVYAEVYDDELPWVTLGDEAEMTLASVPDKTFRGNIEYIYPYSEASTRTTRVRMAFDNTEGLLRPEMFAQVTIRSASQIKRVVIPAEAVVRTGVQTQVFVALGQGKYEPRVVKLGVESGGTVAVLEGVEAGDEVVTSAQFFVDSESKLREATAKLMDGKNVTDDRSGGSEMP